MGKSIKYKNAKKVSKLKLHELTECEDSGRSLNGSLVASKSETVTDVSHLQV